MTKYFYPFLGEGLLGRDFSGACPGALGKGTPSGGFILERVLDETLGTSGLAGEGHLKEQGEVHPLDGFKSSCRLIDPLLQVLLIAGILLEGEEVRFGGINLVELVEKVLSPLGTELHELEAEATEFILVGFEELATAWAGDFLGVAIDGLYSGLHFGLLAMEELGDGLLDLLESFGVVVAADHVGRFDHDQSGAGCHFGGLRSLGNPACLQDLVCLTIDQSGELFAELILHEAGTPGNTAWKDDGQLAGIHHELRRGECRRERFCACGYDVRADFGFGGFSDLSEEARGLGRQFEGEGKRG